jgi:hypothetical protein
MDSGSNEIYHLTHEWRADQPRRIVNHERDCGLTHEDGRCECPQRDNELQDEPHIEGYWPRK